MNKLTSTTRLYRKEHAMPKNWLQIVDKHGKPLKKGIRFKV